MTGHGRLVVVSNRLPIRIETTETGKRVYPSCGGLVSALVPILRESGGCWVGWTGTDYDETLPELFRGQCQDQQFSFEPVFLTAAERSHYYRGFSNEIIWPLFHDLPSRCQFNPAHWNVYDKVNGKFADAVERVAEIDDVIWVHDYHLMLLAGVLRARGLRHRLAYFHHIPFPSPDIFEMLPWRVEVLRALMNFNILGFQSQRDQRNFVACLRRCLPAVRISQRGEAFLARTENLSATIGTYPIGIDYEGFAAEASDSAVVSAADMIQRKLGTRMILGIDRLDYTKGIPERLIAFQTLLEINPGLRGQITMAQIVVPSREDIPEYEQLRLRIETLISKINGEYGNPGWVPIHYFYRSLSKSELIAFYRAADIALVTPLKDGMNLVAKEFCACRVDNTGVLVLSEFAGAADKLKCGALLVNPHDTDKVAAVLETALRMREFEQYTRMHNMRSQVRRHDVFRWSRSFDFGSSYGGTSLPTDSPQPLALAAMGRQRLYNRLHTQEALASPVLSKVIAAGILAGIVARLVKT